MKKKLEEALRVAHIKIGFDSIISGINYTDSHSTLPVFGTRWGRGVLAQDESGLFAIIGSYGTSHAHLKRGVQPGERTAGTFYYGYDPLTKTLYLEYGADRTFEFNNKVNLAAIIEALQRSNGPFKDIKLQ